MTIENQEEVIETPAVEPQEPAPSKDYSKDFEELKALSQKQASDLDAYKRDIQAHKETLAKEREEYRRRSLLALGDTESVKEEEEKQRTTKIQEQFYKVFPKAKELLEGNGQAQPAGQPSVAEMAFYNSARERASDMAKKIGFESQEGQQVMVTLGDYLINITPQWKERFYGRGDMKVLEEVNQWIQDKVFTPRDKAIEARLIEKIKKQGRYAAPVPPRSGGSISKPQTPQLNANKPNERSQMLQHLAEKYMRSAE